MTSYSPNILNTSNTEAAFAPNLATALSQFSLIGFLAAMTVFFGVVVTPFFVASYLFVDLVFLILWHRRLFCLTPLACGWGYRLVIGMTLPVCFALVLVVLLTWADPEVRTGLHYQAGFLIAWGAVLIWVHLFAYLIGLGWLEQGLERRNLAAVWAGVGLTVGATLAVAGANIGEGPTMATTIGPMFLAVGGLLVLWGLFAAVTANTAAVTVERDRSSGLRLASLLVSWGLVLGRSVAGDWVGVEATWRDFLFQGLLPGLVLLGLAIAFEILARPNRHRPFPPLAWAGILPSSLYMIAGLAWLWQIGVPS